MERKNEIPAGIWRCYFISFFFFWAASRKMSSRVWLFVPMSQIEANCRGDWQRVAATEWNLVSEVDGLSRLISSKLQRRRKHLNSNIEAQRKSRPLGNQSSFINNHLKRACPNLSFLRKLRIQIFNFCAIILVFTLWLFIFFFQSQSSIVNNH